MINEFQFKFSSEIDPGKPLVFFVFADIGIKSQNMFDESLLSQLANNRDFTGKTGECLVLDIAQDNIIRTYVLMGLGNSDDVNGSLIRKASGNLGRLLRNNNINDSQCLLPACDLPDTSLDTYAGNMVEGITLGLYEFSKWKSKITDSNKKMFCMDIVSDSSPNIEDAIKRGQSVSRGVMLARDLVNSPANRMNPTNMSETAQSIAEDQILEVSILEESDMANLGMESLLGVSKGSVQPAKLIVLEYNGDSDNPDNNIALVGKGITFDTGGISLKPPGGMESMKGDMAGGASVIGLMRIIADLKPTINVMGIVAATENMPGGNAQKPGDVVKAMNGKTIEVINTDAEGRLVLADALSYAESKGIINVIDIATLTGAMVVSLGKVCTGYMTNNQLFGNKLREASRISGEKFWELPLFDEYDDLIKSDVADMKNTGGRQAGSITAAKLLEKFVGDMNWIHLDIAGTSTSARTDGFDVKGATGHPVLTLLQLVMDMSQD